MLLASPALGRVRPFAAAAGASGRGGVAVLQRTYTATRGRCANTAAAATATMQPFTIIGGGRVGEALAAMNPAGTDVIVRRGEPLPSGAAAPPPGTPIVVATRNDALAGVVDATPPARRGDLVFIQNGMLQPFLDARGLGDATTQLLVYFAVAAKGDAPADGVTDHNPEGLTAAHGPHAAAVAARLHAGGLSCKVLERGPFMAAMLEKLVWICAFMLVGAKHGGVTVGEVEAQHGGEVAALIEELSAAGAAELGVELEQGTVPRLMAYARSIAHFPTAVKEFEWRNGWFWSLSERAVKEGRPDPCPTHTSLLKEVKAV